MRRGDSLIEGLRAGKLKLLCLLLPLVGGRFAAATDTVWSFNGDGNWTEAAKWSNGEPNSSAFNAFIEDGDTAATVTLNASRTIGSLTLGGNDTL